MTHGMPPSIFEFLEDREDLSLFVELLERCDLRELLEEEEHEVTVFAPKDSAVRQLVDTTWDELTNPANKDQLRQLLRRHIVPRLLKSSQFRDRKIETLGGWMAPMEVNKDGVAYYAGSRITRPDFDCHDGLVHFIGGVATD